VTPPALLAAFTARGVRLSVAGDRLHVDAPVGEVTAADREVLAASKAALVTLLCGEAEAIPFDVPDGPCGLCGSPLTWVEDWPEPGTARCLCPTCAARPVMSLAEAFASLTPTERARLDREAANGDDLARAVLNELSATTPKARA
jgi:hypothetical protein